MYLCNTIKGLKNTLKVNYDTGKKIRDRMRRFGLGDMVNDRRTQGDELLFTPSRSRMSVQPDGVEVESRQVSQELLKCII